MWDIVSEGKKTSAVAISINRVNFWSQRDPLKLPSTSMQVAQTTVSVQRTDLVSVLNKSLVSVRLLLTLHIHQSTSSSCRSTLRPRCLPRLFYLVLR